MKKTVVLILGILLVTCGIVYAGDNIANVGSKIEAGTGMIKPTLKNNEATTLITPPGIQRLGEAKKDDAGLHKGWDIGKHLGWAKIEEKNKDEGVAADIVKEDLKKKEAGKRTTWQITGQGGQSEKYGEVQNQSPIVSE